MEDLNLLLLISIESLKNYFCYEEIVRGEHRENSEKNELGNVAFP